MGFPYDAVRRTVSDLIFAIHLRADPRTPAGQPVPSVPVAEWVVDALVLGRSTRLGGILLLGGLGASSEAVQLVERA